MIFQHICTWFFITWTTVGKCAGFFLIIFSKFNFEIYIIYALFFYILISSSCFIKRSLDTKANMYLQACVLNLSTIFISYFYLFLFHIFFFLHFWIIKSIFFFSIFITCSSCDFTSRDVTTHAFFNVLYYHFKMSQTLVYTFQYSETSRIFCKWGECRSCDIFFCHKLHICT